MGRCVSGVRSSSLARLTIVIALAAVGCSSEAVTPKEPSVVGQSQPLWTNGDFELDIMIGSVPSSWTVIPNLSVNDTGVTLQTPQTLAGLNLQPGGRAATRVVGGMVTEGQTDANAPVAYPKFGHRTAVVNYVPPGLGGMPVAGDQRNVNTLLQQMTVAAGDVDADDNQIHVRFALAPVLGNTTHPTNQQPYYFVQLSNVTQNKVLYTDIAFSNQVGVPWIVSGSVVYTDWQLVDVAPGSADLAIGNMVELRVIAAGCSQSGHPGHVYVDAFGTTLPGLYASASAPSSANAGQDLTYTVRYKNGGASAANNATIEFTTPPNTTFRSVSLASGCTLPAVGATGMVSCNVGSVAAAASGSMQVVVRVDPVASGVITQGNYSIHADSISRLLGSHVSTTITNPDLAVSVSSGLARVGWGQPITYTIVVTNSGTGAAPAASLTDTMPAQLTNVTWTCTATSGGVCAASGTGNISDTTLALPAGATATYVVQASIVSGTGTGSTVHSATAEVTSGGSDANEANNTGTETTPIATVRTLTLTKTPAGAISSSPSGLSCGAGCTSASGSFVDGTPITLTAVAPAMGSLQSWGGACSAAGMASTCMFTISSDQSVTVNFIAPAATVAVSAGDAQKTRVSTPFGIDLDVLVRDSFSAPVSGATVTFSAPSSGASATFSSPTAVTDASGHAHVTATANANAGAYTVNASVPGVATAATFSLTNLGSPASVNVVSGSGQNVVVGSAATDALVVEVRDSSNQPLPGVTVDFAAPGSGATGSLSATSAVTDSSGRASTNVTASNVSGGYSVVASVSGVGSTATFTLTNLPSSSTVISVSTGDAQQAVVGAAFATAIDVRVTDEFGNVVPNAAVSLSVPSSGASATLSAYGLSTDSSGHAVIQAAANTKAGSYVVTASTSGASAPVSVALTNLAGPAASISVAPADTHQSAQVSTAFVSPLLVSVTDAFGNAVSGATVMFVAPSAGPGAALSSASAVTDNAGHASVTATANSEPGSYAITALLGTLGQVDFTLTNTAGSLPAISTVAGSGASSAVGTAFATALEVLVTLDGTPLANAAVTFNAPSSGPTATLSASMVMTDVQGHAKVVATAGTLTGSYTVTASVANGIRSAAFALTNAAGAPATLVSSPGSTPQTAQVSTPFASDLDVKVLDAYGNAVPGASVTFSAPSSGASAALSSASASTDANGRAHVMASANSTAGSYAVTAAVSGVAAPIALQLQNVSGQPLSLVVLDGSPQSAIVNRAFSTNLRVQVKGANGVAVPNTLVTFTTPPGSGASAVLSGATATTNASGVAEVTATAGQIAGAYEVLATIDGGLAVARFSLSNTPGAPAAITASAGATPQSARITTAYANPLGVRVVDAFGNGVPGATIDYTAPVADPTVKLTASSPVTDQTGEASVVAVALKMAGSFSVTAAINGSALSTSFMLTNTAGDPVNIQIVEGIDQSGIATQPFPQPVKIQVRDALGNPVGGAAVHVMLSDGDRYATLSANDLTTNDAGEASVSVTAKDVPGKFTITFSVETGATPVVSTFTVTPIPTKTTLEVDPDTIFAGDDTNIHVSVTSDHGVPSGHVEIFIDTQSVAKLNLSSGSVTWTLSGSEVGTHEISALFEAQDAYGQSRADGGQLTVKEIGAGDAGPAADGGGMPEPENDAGVPPPVPQHIGWSIAGGGCSLAARGASRGAPALLTLAFAYLVFRRRRRG